MLLETAVLHLMIALSAHVRVPTGLSVAIGPLLVLRELKKGTVLVERGRRGQVLWFLHAGAVKEVTPVLESGLERVSWFWYSGELIYSYPGFFAREPASASVELITDCVLLEISFRDLLWLREEFSEVALLVEKIRSQHERARAAQAMDLVELNAKERYQKFFASHKELFNVARHRDIADFLGIKDDGFHRYQ